MNPLIAIAANLFPEILKVIAGDKGGEIGKAVEKAVTDATGKSEPAEVKQKVEADPVAATELQVKLAEIALNVRKAEAEAAQKQRELELAEQQQRDKARADAFAHQLKLNQQSDDATSAARTALRELTELTPSIAWTPSILSYIVVIGFLAIIGMLMVASWREAPITDNTNSILYICIGALASGFATVLNFWLGSSVGSRDKDSVQARQQTVSQVSELVKAGSEAEKKKELADTAVKAAEGKPQPIGPSKSIVGKMSHFGGPEDTGMKPDEGLALFEKSDVPAFSKLFLPEQPAGTSGLGRRLDPKAYYLACRWDYHETPRSHLRTIQAKVTNPRNGRSALAQPADWGPNAATGRVADLSPGLAEFLGLTTDEVCQVDVPLPASVMLATENTGAGHLKVLSLQQIKNVFGDFNFAEAQGGAITILGDWVEKHIVTVDIPQLAKLKKNTRVECHKLIASQLQAAFAEIEKRGLLDRVLVWDGLWVPRHKTWNPARTLSSHSWGIAFDINARWNGYGVEAAPKGGMGSVVELVPVLESFGFAWGGYFSKGSEDGMHFEFCRT